MDNATLMYIVIGVLSLFFILLLIFSFKTWRILHLISAFFLFIAAGFFIYMAAATLKTQEAWRTHVNELTAKVATERENIDQLLGKLDEVKEEVQAEGGFSVAIDNNHDVPDSIPAATAALERVLYDRGLVWRNCAPSVAGDSITLTIAAPVAEPEPEDGAAPAEGAEPAPADGAEPAPADGAEPPAAPARPGGHGIAVNTILYGFLEGDSVLAGNLEGFTVPRLYLGEFRVTDRTDTSITIKPTMRLSPRQIDSLGAGNWAVYDNMPIDSHYTFAGLSEEELKALLPHASMTISDGEYNTRIAQVFRYMEGLATGGLEGKIPSTPAELAAKIPKESVLLDDAQYETFIQQYIRDGSPADREKDSPDRIWKRVTFKKAHSIPVDAGGAAEGGPAVFDTKNFDIRGLAVNEHLKQGEATEFEIGDTAVFDAKTADKLIADGVVEPETELLYVRQLHDYNLYFNDGFRQELLFEDVADVIKRDTKTLLSANTRALEQVSYRADEIMKLQQDREGFQREAGAVAGVLGKVEARRSAVQSKLSETFRANLQLAQQIRTMQTQMAAEIYRRAAPAAPSQPAPSEPALPEGAVSAP